MSGDIEEKSELDQAQSTRRTPAALRDGPTLFEVLLLKERLGPDHPLAFPPRGRLAKLIPSD